MTDWNNKKVRKKIIKKLINNKKFIAQIAEAHGLSNKKARKKSLYSCASCCDCGG